MGWQYSSPHSSSGSCSLKKTEKIKKSAACLAETTFKFTKPDENAVESRINSFRKASNYIEQVEYNCTSIAEILENLAHLLYTDSLSRVSTELTQFKSSTSSLRFTDNELRVYEQIEKQIDKINQTIAPILKKYETGAMGLEIPLKRESILSNVLVPINDSLNNVLADIKTLFKGPARQSKGLNSASTALQATISHFKERPGEADAVLDVVNELYACKKVVGKAQEKEVISAFYAVRDASIGTD